MLKALLHGKAGRIEQNEQGSVSWRELFRQREDLMTAAIFGRFAYLSSSIQSTLLRSWFQPDVDFTDFEHIEFWPRYALGESDEASVVEPDLLMRFSACNLLVEVKPPQGGDQNYQQWQREIAAFLQSDEQAELPLYFLALGRIERSDARRWAAKLQAIFPSLVAVGAIKWQPVADSILRLGSEQNASPQDLRVLDDMMEALKLYGLKCGIGSWDELVGTPLQQSLLSSGLHSLESSFRDWRPIQVNTGAVADWSALERFSARTPGINMEYIEQWTL